MVERKKYLLFAYWISKSKCYDFWSKTLYQYMGKSFERIDQ